MYDGTEEAGLVTVASLREALKTASAQAGTNSKAQFGANAKPFPGGKGGGLFGFKHSAQAGSSKGRTAGVHALMKALYLAQVRRLLQMQQL